MAKPELFSSLADFSVHEGRIIDEGPYQGQPWQVVPLHLLTKMRLYDRIVNGHYTFDLTPSDRMTYGFPAAAHTASVIVESGKVKLELD